jgi:maltose alpha-D-glucosyltransferase/alpha-amylase
MRLNVGIRRRLAPLLGFDRRKLEVMHGLLMTLPGTPILYYGDEIGMGDDVSLPDRHGVRTPMAWTDAPGVGFTDHPVPYQPPVADGPGGYHRANVAAQERDPDSLLHWVRRLVATRRTLPALAPGGRFGVLDAGDPRVLAVHHVGAGSHVVAVHNLADAPATVRVAAPAAGPWRSVWSDGTTRHDGALDRGNLALELPPYGYAWWTTG